MPRDKQLIEKEVEKGRPLWLQEINKETPAGAQYEIESGFGDNSTLYKTRAHAFQSGNQEQNQTMREEPDLDHFMKATSTMP